MIVNPGWSSACIFPNDSCFCVTKGLPHGRLYVLDELRAHLVKVHKLQNKKVLGLVRQNDISIAGRIPQGK